MTCSDEWFERAKELMPGGVNSPVRSFKAVGGVPRLIRRAQGCHLFDEDGRRYVDYVGSWGPMIAGHSHPAVVEAIERQLRNGTSFGAPHRLEIELAGQIVDCVPSVEKVRMVSSGTEAAMTAVRLARAATGRSGIVKFAGCYHGHSDALLAEAGSGAASLSLPPCPGVTAGAVGDTIVSTYNDADAVDQLICEQRDRIAAIIVEPVAGNMGVVPPKPGFLERLRATTHQHGTLLVFDEVMTGFRLARGGAQQRFGVMPDLTVMGKVIGGGLPVGAVGGPARLMDQLAPSGPVYQAGTLSGNPLAMAAGAATLRLLDDDAYARLEESSARLQTMLESSVTGAGLRAAVQRVGSMISIFFGSDGVDDFQSARRANHQDYARFFHAMLDRGVYLPPSGYEAWFVSLAHDEAAMTATSAAISEAINVIRNQPADRR